MLTWSSPEDPSPGGSVTDLDLHLRHPNGPWQDDLWDVDFTNRNPDWGIEGDTSDDPTLDRDAISTEGPEQITMRQPEDGVVYQVGVHVYNDSNNGPTLAEISASVGPLFESL